jgi:site-specific DNA-methyltransferase (adenine-specific)
VIVKRRPGEIRDAIVGYLRATGTDASVGEIRQAVAHSLGDTLADSSVRSYLRLNANDLLVRTSRGRYCLRERPEVVSSASQPAPPLVFSFGQCSLYEGDCLDWLSHQQECSIHAIVTDPPYGLVEYSEEEQTKLRCGRGGVWRIPPSFDGCQRSPLPRFTVLDKSDHENMVRFFTKWGRAVIRVLVPGAHLAIAANPLLSYLVAMALVDVGLERRGEIIRLVTTMRGGDRPKNAHEEFSGVTVMPRSMWEPWLLFRKPLAGRVQDNLRLWKTGGLRRPCADRPFGDVIPSHTATRYERCVAPHPSLKPQAFLRKLVHAMLPLGKGIILDPFCGSGSTLAAAEAVGYPSIGIEKDKHYTAIAHNAIPKLSQMPL